MEGGGGGNHREEVEEAGGEEGGEGGVASYVSGYGEGGVDWEVVLSGRGERGGGVALSSSYIVLMESMVCWASYSSYNMIYNRIKSNPPALCVVRVKETKCHKF